MRLTPSPQQTFAGLAIAYLAVATAFNVVVPVFEAPDEHTHYYMAQQLAYHGTLPVQTLDPDARGPWEQEGSQPPLYYVLAAPLIRLTGAHLADDGLWYNDQNTMGNPALVGNENRFVHPPELEGWPWHGYALAAHLVRGLSTLLGLIALLAAYEIARRVFPARPWLAVAAAGLVALNPQFLALAGAVSNDNLMNALAAVTLLQLIRLAEGRRDRATVLTLVLAAGLAPLAKLSGLALVGFAALTVVGIWAREGAGWAARFGGRSGPVVPRGAEQPNRSDDTHLTAKSGSSDRFFATTLGMLLLATLLLAGWWYLRNLQLYGDPTGVSHMLPPGTRRAFRWARWWSGLPDELYGVWLSTWGIFGWFTVMLPAAVYQVITALSLLALLGLASAAVKRADWVSWRHLAWLAAWGALIFVSLLRWLTIIKGGHGRLLFPAIALLAVGLVAGWRALVPRRVGDRMVAVGVTGAFAVLSIFSLLGVVRPAYALAPSVPASVIPKSAEPVGVTFDGRLRLVALQKPERVMEGDPVRVTLYWQVVKPVTREGYVGLRWDQRRAGPPDAAGKPTVDTVPGGVALSYPGMGTSPPKLWRPGSQVYVDRQVVAAPTLLPVETVGGEDLVSPAMPALSIQLYNRIAAEPWPIDDPPGTHEWSTAIAVVPSKLARFDPPDAEPLAAFDNGLQLFTLQRWDTHTAPAPAGLAGLHLNPQPYPICIHPESANGTAANRRVLLAWHATRNVSEDLQAFVHLVKDGQVVDQFDGPPGSYGGLPTSEWLAGDWIYAAMPWTLPPTARDRDDFTLRVGLYRLGDGSRIPATRSDGTAWADSAVDVAQLVVMEECGAE